MKLLDMDFKMNMFKDLHDKIENSGRWLETIK